MKFFIIHLALALNPILALSQAGILDSTFAGDGIITADIGNTDDLARAVIVKPDGKIVVAGYAETDNSRDALLLQYNTDGTLDNTFNGSGILTMDFGSFYDEFNSLAIDAEGKIVACGTSGLWYGFEANNIVIARFNANGNLDSTFNTNGLLVIGTLYDDEEGKAVTIQSDGKIVVGGEYPTSGVFNYFLAYRINPNGTLDTTFGDNGKVTVAWDGIIYVNSIGVQQDGKIVLGGNVSHPNFDVDFALLRLNSDGSIDSTFGSDGLVIKGTDGNDHGESMVIQSDGKIVMGGYLFPSDFILVRFKTNGDWDNSFGTDGIVTCDFFSNDDRCWEIILQPDGKIIAAGQAQDGQNSYFGLARFKTNGNLDSTFGDDGKTSTAILSDFNHAYGLSLQPDNKIIAAGSADNSPGYKKVGISRYLNDIAVGIEETEQHADLNVYPNPFSTFTTISYSLYESSNITLELFDLAGRKIETLFDERIGAGSHKFRLDRKQLRTGVYLLRMQTAYFYATEKLIIQ